MSHNWNIALILENMKYLKHVKITASPMTSSTNKPDIEVLTKRIFFKLYI